MKQFSLSLPNILHKTRYAIYSDNFSALLYGCRTLKRVQEKMFFLIHCLSCVRLAGIVRLHLCVIITRSINEQAMHVPYTIFVHIRTQTNINLTHFLI